jgi:membrane protein DedA with SNARE-associated domain/rhodanese-related sulfurtransferase
MIEPSQFLIKHGAPFLFATIFLEQIGLPLPALPWLLVAGALSATGKFNPIVAGCIVVLACAPADALWFYLGRYRGSQVMGFLCRISLEPDSCVRRTQNLFSRYGLRGVMISKFVPGLNTMAAPLAGMSGVKASRFLLADAIGSLLYGTCFIGLGFIFCNQIQKLATTIAQVGGSALLLIVALVAIYLAYKYWRRQRVLRELRMARITVEELHERQAAGENFIIVDLRSAGELQQNPGLIQGAIHLLITEVETRYQEIPHDREVILYCSCPNEITSAKAALLLRRKGITRVRPLLGGIDAWKELNYPLEVRSNNAAPVTK